MERRKEAEGKISTCTTGAGLEARVFVLEGNIGMRGGQRMYDLPDNGQLGDGPDGAGSCLRKAGMT